MPKKKKRRPQHLLVREDLDPVDYDPAIVAEVESLFKKKFAYTKEIDEKLTEWPLPPASEWFTSDSWQDKELQSLNTRLNEVKSSLSHLDITQWHEHTTQTNRAGTICSYLHRHRKPELCTQAWCKFYEVVSSYPLVPHNEATFSSIHLCEAPGAFITSLNHYLKSTEYRGQWQWLGSTLNPHYEGNDASEAVLADRFICATLDHWHWGTNNTGNIMHRENIESLVEAACQIEPVQLVTADGSIDCQNTPELQEVRTARLHFCEIAAGLLLLSPGGAMVTKMFTLFEDSSISLLYLLNAVFKQVHVFKPATSKSGNSEVYVVSVNYQGIPDEIQQVLLANIESETSFCLFPKSVIPDSFMNQHRDCCRNFANWQIQTIEENKALFNNILPEKRSRLEATRACAAATYVARYEIRHIGHRDFVARYSHEDRTHHLLMRQQKRHTKGNTRHKGSYEGRIHDLTLSWKQKLGKMKLYDLPPGDEDMKWLKCARKLEDNEIETWNVIEGARVEQICSSQFCSVQLLIKYNECVSQSKMELSVQPAVSTSLQAILQQLIIQQLTERDQKLHVYNHDTSESVLLMIIKNFFLESVVVVSSPVEEEESVTLHLMQSNFSALPRGEEELVAKSLLLDNLCQLLEVIKTGDHFITVFYGSVTRFSACLLYVLYRTFEEVAMLPPSSGSVGQFVVCRRCRGSPESLLHYLKLVQKRSSSLANSTMDVLQFIPVYDLFEHKFNFYLDENNDVLLKSRMNHLIQQGKRELRPP